MSGAAVIYLGWFLTQESAEALLSVIKPIHRNVFAHHATYAFRPSAEQVAAFGNSTPGITACNVIGVAEDEMGQAVIIDLPNIVTGGHERMHVTISTANDATGKPVPPKYSNVLIADLSKVRPVQPFEIYGVNGEFPGKGV